MSDDVAHFKAKVTTEADSKGLKKFERDLRQAQKNRNSERAKLDRIASREFVKEVKNKQRVEGNAVNKQLRLQERALKREQALRSRLDPGFHKGRLQQQIGERRASNAARRSLGMRELPDLVNGQKAGFAKTMLQGLGMGGASAGFVGELLQAAPAVAAIAAGVFLVKQAFDAVVFSVKAVTSLVFELSKTLAQATFHALDFTQRMELGFGALLKGKNGDPVGVFNAVRTEAQNLGLDVEDTTESYRKLLAAQFSVAQATELTRSMADLQAAGASQPDIQHALLAISQIKMKDKLQAEELTRQLANAGVSSELVYKHVQKRLGIAPGKEGFQKVQAMQQAGEINAATAIPAIIDAIAEKTGSANPGEFALKKAQARVSGMLMQMKGMVTNAFIDVAQHIATPVTEAFATVFNGIKQIAGSPEIVALKNAFGDVFIATAEFLARQWPAIQPVIMNVIDVLTTGFSNITNYIRENGDTIAEKIRTIAVVGLTVGIVMMTVTAKVYQLADSLLSLFQKLEMLKPYIKMAMKVGGFAFEAAAGATGIPGAGFAAGLATNALGGAAGAFSSAKNMLAPGASDEISMLASNGFNEKRLIAEEQALSANRGSGIASMFDNIAPKNALDAIGGKAIWAPKTEVGAVNVNIDTIDLDDPEGAGGIIGAAVRKEIHKTHDEL